MKFTSLAIIFVTFLSHAGDIPQIGRDTIMFVDKFCISCHDSLSEKGDLDLTKLSTELKTHKIADTWYKVMNSINAGEMPPPKKKKQPSNSEKAVALQDLSKSMVKARKYLGDSHGKVTMRRMSKAAYKNAIEDLLGVEINPEKLPDDHDEKSFDTYGASLYFSSGQLLEYLSVARKAFELLLHESSPAKTITYNPEKIISRRVKQLKFRDSDYITRVKKFSNDPSKNTAKKLKKYRLESVSLITGKTERLEKEIKLYELFLSSSANDIGAGFFSSFQRSFPLKAKMLDPGKYRLTFSAGVSQDGHKNYLSIVNDSNFIHSNLRVLNIKGSLQKPQTVDLLINITPETRTILIRPTEVSTSLKNFHRSYQKSFEKDQKLPENALWISDVSLHGPLLSPEKENIKTTIFPEFTGYENEHNYALEVISKFYYRASRGETISEELVAKLLKIFNEQREQGKNLKESLAEPLAIILSLPEFIFIAEPASDKSYETQLDNFQLATRIAFFLWNSVPDEELLDLAERGELSDPETLNLQINRMLKDRKNYRFIKSFVGQWLHLERLDLFQFEKRYYEQFETTTKQSAKVEVYKTFQSVMHESLGVYKLLDPGFVIVDDFLASHYGIKGSFNSKFQKINLPRSSQRGGLLTMAATLAMGSDGVVSSPVERGAWILRKLLNKPPAPAPADIPALDNTTVGLSKREILQKHTEEPQCYQCHSKIDPLGLALEDFDASGKIRNQSKSSRKTKLRKVNGSNIQSDNYSFTDFQSMRSYIRSQKQSFVNGFIEQLTSYALGRELSFSDEDLLKSINHRSRKYGYKIPSIIKAIIFSKAFRYK